uniref:Wall-associated receptor kinase galacturonan-binding domain-containing protein n=1 Tax=Leersia perrieri TaxID=77586 RepID=A0A0D9X8K0_9ORYZ
MASINLSLAIFAALFSGFLILGLGAVGYVDECGFLCVDGAYVTCANYPGQQFPGYNCVCRPSDGRGCAVHNPDGSIDVECRK